MIEIEIGDDVLRASTVVFSDQVFKLALECAAIQEARQLIVTALVTQLASQLPILGHILQNNNEADILSDHIDHRRGGKLQFDQSITAVVEIQRRQGQLALEQLADRDDAGRLTIRVENQRFVYRRIDHRLLFRSKQFFSARIEQFDALFRIDHDHRVVNRIERCRNEILLCSQTLFNIAPTNGLDFQAFDHFVIGHDQISQLVG